VDIGETIWLPAVEDKLATKHRLTTEETEEVFANDPLVTFVERGRVQGEDVYAAWGRSDAGRYVLALFIWKLTGDALVLSARDMDAKERRYYAKTHR
jgi:uncharacterized DUF497 family protein